MLGVGAFEQSGIRRYIEERKRGAAETRGARMSAAPILSIRQPRRPRKSVTPPG